MFFGGIILNNVSLFYIFQVLEGEDLAKGNWQQFLKRNQEVGLDTVGFAVVEEVLMEASALTMAVLTGLRREQTLPSTQATARRAGPPFCNTWARRAICDNVNTTVSSGPSLENIWWISKHANGDLKSESGSNEDLKFPFRDPFQQMGVSFYIHCWKEEFLIEDFVTEGKL